MVKLSTRDRVLEAYARTGSIKGAAREAGCDRNTARYHIRRASEEAEVPRTEIVKDCPLRFVPGRPRTYLITSAQHDAVVHEPFWENLLAYAKAREADVLVKSFRYSLGGSPGSPPEEVEEYVQNRRIRLAPDLVYCGDVTTTPTAVRPLSGLRTYGQGSSTIFGHAKVALESTPAPKGQRPALCYTTGCVTAPDYLEGKAGRKAEFHHSLCALIVEVDGDGAWWVRQLHWDGEGFQDLDYQVTGGQILAAPPIAAVVWGDWHAPQIDEIVADEALGVGGILDSLQPRYQFHHDVLNFRARNHHDRGKPLLAFQKWQEGQDSVERELQEVGALLERARRPWSQSVVVDSNHDGALARWLDEADYRNDPQNAVVFLSLQLERYRNVRHREFRLLGRALSEYASTGGALFLGPDQSVIVAGVEHGMHGHRGANGARGTPMGLAQIGRKSNTAHTHSCAIVDGLYVAGCSCELEQGYNEGPSSWTHSHIVTYPSGKRTILTHWNDGRWRR